MTVEYTAGARKIVDDYLQAIRDRLWGAKTVDADEVLDGIGEHLEKELAARSQPVSPADVNDVLTRLGPPEQIVPDEGMSWWQKMALRLRQGPEDWRLAYLSFGALTIGSLLWPLTIGSLLWPIGLVASFVLARAAVSFEDKIDPPAKKWLIYPSLIIVYALVGFLVLLWPGLVAITTATEMAYWADMTDRNNASILSITAAGALAIAVWWSVLWVMWRRRPDVVRSCFRPFADNWTSRRFGKLVLEVWGLAIFLIAGVVLRWYYP